MNKSIIMVSFLTLTITLIKGQDYKNKVLNLETGEVKTYMTSPDSFPNTLSDHIIGEFLTGQTLEDILNKIQGTWIYDNSITHKGDTISKYVTMSFKEFQFKLNKRFSAVSKSSGDKVEGKYEIDITNKKLKIFFDKPYDDLKGGDWGKDLPEDTKKSFIFSNLLFQLNLISSDKLIFVSTHPIGNFKGDSFSEIEFNYYKKK